MVVSSLCSSWRQHAQCHGNAIIVVACSDNCDINIGGLVYNIRKVLVDIVYSTISYDKELSRCLFVYLIYHLVTSILHRRYRSRARYLTVEDSTHVLNCVE